MEIFNKNQGLGSKLGILGPAVLIIAEDFVMGDFVTGDFVTGDFVTGDFVILNFWDS